MIDLKSKGSFRALFDSIEGSGHSLVVRDGVLVPSNEAIVQAIIDSYSLVDAKADTCAKVLEYAASLRNRVTAGIAEGEMASWSIKRTEAEDYGRVGDLAPCPALRAEAQRRGITLGQLVAKVNANAARFIATEAAIGGTDGKHRDAINSLTTFEAVAAYDYISGWPEV